jgi:hypothetical protein
MSYYLGKRLEGDLILFQSADRPTRESTKGRFTSAFGPFSRIGAAYYARFGYYAGTPLADVERLAAEDPNLEWQSIREVIEIEMTMTTAERLEHYQCMAEEYEPDKPSLSAVDVTDMLRQARVLEDIYQE